MARHLWWMAVLYAAVFALPITVGNAMDGSASVFSVVVTVLLSLPFGFAIGLSARNAVQRWDLERGDTDSGPPSERGGAAMAMRRSRSRPQSAE